MMDTPNRAQRRAAARAAKGRSKPRSQHRRTVVVNPITYAKEGANLVPRHKRDAITGATRSALRAVRTGTTATGNTVQKLPNGTTIHRMGG